MLKYALRSLDKYWMSIEGDDPVCLNIRLEIKQTGDKTFEVKVLDATIDSQECPFACWLIMKLPVDALCEVNQRIKDSVVTDVTPSLYTLFYTGDIQDANYTPAL